VASAHGSREAGIFQQGAVGPGVAARSNVQRYSHGGGRARSSLAAVLVVLACLGVVSSVAAVWAHHTLLNTDRYVATVTPLIGDPSVTRSLGDFTSAKVLQAIPIQAQLTQQVRDQLGRKIDSLLRTGAASAAWISVNRATHRRLLAALHGPAGTGGGTVALDLMPFVSFGVIGLVDILPSSVAGRLNLPRIDMSASSDRQRAQLAAALGRPLPRSFARVTLLRSAQLARAQRALRLFDVLTWVLVGVTALLTGLAIAVSPHRWRTLLYLGAGVAVVSLIARLLVGRLNGPIVRSFNAGDLAPAFKAGVAGFLHSLAAFTLWPLFAGVAVAAVACLACLLARRPRRQSGTAAGTRS
jgi:hypothetical protein